MADLFRSENLLVRSVGRGGRDRCVVTFACLSDVPGLAVPGFAEAFLRGRGIDAVHVTCAGNHWYQYPELPSALASIRDAVAPYGRVLAYGSSMGGYAALRCGGPAGAHEALAISPQFSIDPRRAAFETRWAEAAAAIRFLHEEAPITVAGATVVYDPRSLDARHAELIAAAAPVRRIPVLHAGHPAGTYLAETGLLPELVLGVLDGCLPPDFGRRARAARRRSANYHFTMSQKVSFRRFAAKLALARRAAEAAPHVPAYHSELALLLDLDRDPANAEAAHRRAAIESGDNPVFSARLARFLLRRGRIVEAIPWAEAALAAAPDDRSARHLRAVALFAAGDRVAATRSVFAGPADHAFVREVVRDWAWLLRWRPDPAGWCRRWSGRRRPRLPLGLGGA